MAGLLKLCAITNSHNKSDYTDLEVDIFPF